MYDIIIIGAGPAGLTAALYAAKNKLKALVIAKEIPSYDRDNFNSFNFKNLNNEFESGLKNNPEFLELHKGTEVTALEKNVVSFSVEIKSGALYYSKCVIIASGNAETIFDLITNKDSEGKIKVDSQMRTNIPGVFAAGLAAVGAVQDIFVNSGQGARAVLSAAAFLNQKRQ